MVMVLDTRRTGDGALSLRYVDTNGMGGVVYDLARATAEKKNYALGGVTDHFED